MGWDGGGFRQVQAAGFQLGLFIHTHRGRRRGQLSARPRGEERGWGRGKLPETAGLISIAMQSLSNREEGKRARGGTGGMGECAGR